METLPLPDEEIAAQNLLERRTSHGPDTRYTRPAKHYDGLYLWDSLFAAWINANAGVVAAENGLPTARHWIDAAQTEHLAVIEGQDPETGFISNLQHLKRNIEPEGKKHNYTQPALLAFSILETYEASMEVAKLTGDEELVNQTKAWIQAVYPKASKFYAYHDRYLSNSIHDPLVGLFHPHASGRDSDPTFNVFKRWLLQRKGKDTPVIVDKINSPLDYAAVLYHGVKLRKAANQAGLDLDPNDERYPEKKHAAEIQAMRDVYWMNDVMVNCIYADNLYYMAELAKLADDPQGEADFSFLAHNVEENILTRMWSEEDKKFYALDADGNHIKDELTVSNLFPLMLPNVREEQIESLLNTMDESFNTPWPLPSVATDSPGYDPHNHMWDRLWGGGVWVNVVKLLEQGLRKQLARYWIDLEHRPDLMGRMHHQAERFDKRPRFMVKIKGLWEHYDPEDGHGHRRRAKRFAWSNGGLMHICNARRRMKQQRAVDPDTHNFGL